MRERERERAVEPTMVVKAWAPLFVALLLAMCVLVRYYPRICSFYESHLAIYVAACAVDTKLLKKMRKQGTLKRLWKL